MDIQTVAIFIRAWDWKVWEGIGGGVFGTLGLFLGGVWEGIGGGGIRDTGLVTVDNLFENPAR